MHTTPRRQRTSTFDWSPASAKNAAHCSSALNASTLPGSTGASPPNGVVNTISRPAYGRAHAHTRRAISQRTECTRGPSCCGATCFRQHVVRVCQLRQVPAGLLARRAEVGVVCQDNQNLLRLGGTATRHCVSRPTRKQWLWVQRPARKQWLWVQRPARKQWLWVQQPTRKQWLWVQRMCKHLWAKPVSEGPMDGVGTTSELTARRASRKE